MSKYLSQLLELPRQYKIWMMRIIDMLVLAGAFGYVILIQLAKLGFNQKNMAVLLTVNYTPFLLTGLVSLFVASLVLNRTGFYRWQIRFLNFPVFNSLMLAMLSSSFAMLFASWVFSASLSLFSTVNYLALGLIGLLGVRAMAVIALESTSAEQGVIIVGADEQGLQLAQALLYSSYRQPVAFIDENKRLQNTVIYGIPVYGMSEVGKVVKKHVSNYSEMSICLSQSKVSSDQRKVLLEQVSDYPLSIEYLDHVEGQIVAGKQLVESVRAFEITDLLGRDAIPPDEQLIRQAVSNKNILITGAGGSIGSELVRQIAAVNPASICLVELSEFALYQIQQDLKLKFPYLKTEGVLLDIRDTEKLNNLLKEKNIDVVYHAAAYKHVPIVEENILAGLENNVLGTLSVLNALENTSVSRFTLISTDKAVRPTNIMGASKRVAELLVLDKSMQNKNINYSIVRFGNVLGSSGSVVPLFKSQIAKGGPVTVTHKEVTRFFMTISEAAQLVVQASALAKSGDIFLLDMGEPVKIYDLARRMIHLLGHEVRDKDHSVGIEIHETGLRKGEKLYEELLVDAKSAEATMHPRIFRAVEPQINPLLLVQTMQDITNFLSDEDQEQLKLALQNSWIDYQPAPS